MKLNYKRQRMFFSVREKVLVVVILSALMSCNSKRHYSGRTLEKNRLVFKQEWSKKVLQWNSNNNEISGTDVK